MTKLFKITSTLLLVVFGITSASSQEAVLDSKFGKKGKLELKGGYVSNLFYDTNSKHIFITTSLIKIDRFSSRYVYYKDGVQKINLITGNNEIDFGKKGKVVHSVNSINSTRGNQNWISSKNNIICLNNRTKDKEMLIFDKKEGTIRTVTNPINPSIEKSLYFDESDNKLLVEDDDELYWHEADGNKKFIHELNAKSITYDVVKNLEGELLIPIKEYSSEKEVNNKWSFLSIEKEEILTNHSFDADRRTELKVWNDYESGLIEISKDTLRCRFDALDSEDDWKAIAYESTPRTFPLIFDKGDNILYGYTIETTYKNEGKEMPRFKDIQSAKFILLKFDFTTGQVIKTDLTHILPIWGGIKGFKHLGNDEFIVLVYHLKKRKEKLDLYKFMLK